MTARATAAVSGDRSVGTFAHMGYSEVLKSLDDRIDKLARLKESAKRLSAGAGLMIGLYGFSLELQGRCLALRGVLELETELE